MWFYNPPSVSRQHSSCQHCGWTRPPILSLLSAPIPFGSTTMRIALALLLMLAVTVTASADTGRRGRWRTAPLRTWRIYNGYNVWQPGSDSTYYSPYTPNNTVENGTPTPTPTPEPTPTTTTGQWQNSTTVPNVVPNTTWTDGTTPTQSTPTTQTVDPVPDVSTQTPTTPTTTRTTPSSTRRSSSSASYQYPSPQTNYWNTLNGGNK